MAVNNNGLAVSVLTDAPLGLPGGPDDVVNLATVDTTGGTPALVSRGTIRGYTVNTAAGPAVNDSGTIAGSVQSTDDPTEYHAFKYAVGTGFTMLGGLNGSIVATDLLSFLPAGSGWTALTSAVAINDGGTVAGLRRRRSR